MTNISEQRQKAKNEKPTDVYMNIKIKQGMKTALSHRKNETIEQPCTQNNFRFRQLDIPQMLSNLKKFETINTKCYLELLMTINEHLSL